MHVMERTKRTFSEDRFQESENADPVLHSSITILDGGDIDEDAFFTPTSDDHLVRPTYDVYSLRSNDPDIYSKVAVLLRQMAGVEIPFFVLQILKIAHNDLCDSSLDRARRLYFEIDNKILKSLQAMHRAQMCDRVRGFDSKLGKIMDLIYRHFTDAVRVVSDSVIDQWIPGWPNQIQSPAEPEQTEEPKPYDLSEIMSEISVSPVESTPELPEPGSQVSRYNFATDDSVTDVPVLPTVEQGTVRATVESSQSREEKIGLEYGMMFDFFAPEPKIFSVYMQPNLEYTTEPKEVPMDPDSTSVLDDKDSDNPGPLWKQLKRVTTRMTRSLRGNPKYFVTPQDLQ